MGGFLNDTSMQHPSAQSRSLNQAMPFHAALGEVVYACKFVLLGLGGNWLTQLHMKGTARLLEKKCAFLAGSWVGCRGGLRNFWADKLTAAQIFVNFGLSSSAGENCAIHVGSVDWQNCAILEPNRLPDKIAQFLEGRLVALQKCTIFLGKLLSLQLDQVWVNNL